MQAAQPRDQPELLVTDSAQAVSVVFKLRDAFKRRSAADARHWADVLKRCPGVVGAMRPGLVFLVHSKNLTDGRTVWHDAASSPGPDCSACLAILEDIATWGHGGNAFATEGGDGCTTSLALDSDDEIGQICCSMALRGADFGGRTPLHDAAACGNTAFAAFCLDEHPQMVDCVLRSATPDEAAQDVFRPSIHEGWSALHFAVAAADAEMVALLLARGADARLKESVSGTTPAHRIAEARGDADPELFGARIDEILVALKRAGADLDAVDSQGRTPFGRCERAWRRALLAVPPGSGTATQLPPSDEEIDVMDLACRLSHSGSSQLRECGRLEAAVAALFTRGAALRPRRRRLLVPAQMAALVGGGEASCSRQGWLLPTAVTGCLRATLLCVLGCERRAIAEDATRAIPGLPGHVWQKILARATGAEIELLTALLPLRSRPRDNCRHFDVVLSNRPS